MQTKRIKVNVNRAKLFWMVSGLCLVSAAFPVIGQQTVFTYDASGNTVAITSTGSTFPAINAQPQTQLLESNTPVSFSVVVVGSGVSYQWLSNGVPILGATGDTLFLPGLTGTNGSFSVIASNYSGSVTSAPAAIWADSNGNGIPDWWEMQYFGNLNQTADGDFDGDGVNNLDEYLEGTDPTNPLSYDPRLYVDAEGGTVSVSPDLPYYTMGQIVTLAAVPDPGQTFSGWSGGAVGTKRTISLIMTSHKTVTASFDLPLASALDNTNISWTTGGNEPWFGQSVVSEDGIGAAQSGFLEAGQTGGQQSWLQGVTPLSIQPTQLSFWWCVSSESPNSLSFSLDGSVNSGIAGAGAGWQLIQVNLSAGSHVLLWTYTDGGINVPTGLPYADCGWVDEVTITNSP